MEGSHAEHGTHSKSILISSAFLLVFIVVETSSVAYWLGTVNGQVKQNHHDILVVRSKLESSMASTNEESAKIDHLNSQIALLRQEIGYDETLLHQIARKIGAGDGTNQ